MNYVFVNMGFDCIFIEMIEMNGSGLIFFDENNIFVGILILKGFWNLEYICLVVYLIVCFFVGILGNILVLIVYFYKCD